METRKGQGLHLVREAPRQLGGSPAVSFRSVPGRGQSEENRRKGVRHFRRTAGQPAWWQLGEGGIECWSYTFFGWLWLPSCLPVFSQAFILSFCIVRNCVSRLNSGNEANENTLTQFNVYTHWPVEMKLTKHMPVDVDKVHVCFYGWVISERGEICARRKAMSWSYCYLHCSRGLGRLFPSNEKIPVGGREIIFEHLLHAMCCARPYAKQWNLFHLILKTTLEKWVESLMEAGAEM